MALIKQIRQRTGLAIGVIAGGLILFLLGGDLLSPNSSLLNTNQNIIGEIAGEEITLEEFSLKVEEYKTSFQQRTGRIPAEAEMVSIREQACLFTNRHHLRFCGDSACSLLEGSLVFFHLQ